MFPSQSKLNDERSRRSYQVSEIIKLNKQYNFRIANCALSRFMKNVYVTYFKNIFYRHRFFYIIAIYISFVLYYFSFGVVSFILFPKIPDSLKTNYAEEAYNPNGIVPRALSMIKSKFPHVIVCTDIALDPYSSMVCANTELL